jgi:hypothetical protein
MDEMEFQVNEIAILNEKVVRDLPMRIGQKAVILRKSTFSNFDFDIEFDDGESVPVKNSELNKLTDEDKKYMDYIFINNKVSFRNEKYKVIKVNYLTKQANVIKDDKSEYIVKFDDLQPIHIETNENEMGYFEQLGLQIGKLVDKKQKAYGDSVTKCYKIMRVLLEDYRDEEEKTYTIPESLLPQMLLDIRKIDKMNRRFSNPDGDLMGENPYQDDTGYDMLGVRLVEQMNRDGLND